VVGHEAQLQRAADDQTRIAQRSEQLRRERRQVEEERERLEQRQLEARASIARLEDEQRSADERLTEAQRRLFEGREATQHLGRRAAEAGAAHAALVERVSGLQSEVERLLEVAADLEARAASLTVELQTARNRAEELKQSTARNTSQLDEYVLTLDALRAEVQSADDAVLLLRDRSEGLESAVKIARTALESQRAKVAELDIVRATAEGDLGHLAQASLDTVQATLDEVSAEVADLEARGEATPDASVICTDDAEDADDIDQAPAEPVTLAERRALSAEEAIVELRSKIDRLGPVNMMAIEQFDELEERHVFLSTQRTDLVDSIAQTSQAIKRIDETTRQRFGEAFSEINANFQHTFSTLFGGGRAGLTLIDETDPLESGIEIIAQPPGKRLQNVQLLSGGEKALTAIALMFGLFKYKPSPFCLLDEIDAPLDDANIGRFVEMLRGMQQHTQFILITHNRKTMEIADRLYGVTMEEPGVSKLISVQLH
jgi:chromosome segregation protein